MVDDVVAKRVWKFDSGLCKTIPVLNFSKKVVLRLFIHRFEGFRQILFWRFTAKRHLIWHPPKKMDWFFAKKAPRIPRQHAGAAGAASARRGHGLSTITLTLPEKPATSVPAGEEALTSVGSSLHASGQCLVWRGGWVAGLLFSNKHPASVIAQKKPVLQHPKALKRLHFKKHQMEALGLSSIVWKVYINIETLKWMPF